MIMLVLKPFWVPVVLTILGWFALLLWPFPAETNDLFGFGHILTAALRLGIGVVSTLVLWLVFCLLSIGGVI